MLVRFPTSTLNSPSGPLFNLGDEDKHHLMSSNICDDIYWSDYCSNDRGVGEESNHSTNRTCFYLIMVSKRSMREPSLRPFRTPPFPTTTQRWHSPDAFSLWGTRSGSCEGESAGSNTVTCTDIFGGRVLTETWRHLVRRAEPLAALLLHCDVIS